jgi:hypothetical protein
MTELLRSDVTMLAAALLALALTSLAIFRDIGATIRA